MSRHPKLRNRASQKPDDVARRHQIIAAAYAADIPVRFIASELGLTYGSVKVIACRLGITKRGPELANFKRIGRSVRSQFLVADTESLPAVADGVGGQ